MDRKEHVAELIKEAERQTGRDISREEVTRALEGGEAFSVDELLDLLNFQNSESETT